MGEAWGGDRRTADAGRVDRTQSPRRADAATGSSPGWEEAESAGREGKAHESQGRASQGREDDGREDERRAGKGTFDLNVAQVAGSAVAAVVAAKLASNLGVYGTIVGAGVVSVLGTCGGSLLQHVFHRTGRHVQEVAVQARPGVRRVRVRARGWERGRSRADAVAEAIRTGPGAGQEPERLDESELREEASPADTRPDPTVTRPPTGTVPLAGTVPLTGDAAGEDLGAGPAPGAGDHGGAAEHVRHGSRDGYGEPTSYRAGTRNWKRPAAAVALAFGLTMGGITGYEAIAGENISGHGHGTTIGNAVTGHSSSHSGGAGDTPAPGATDNPSGSATTGPGGRRGDGPSAPAATSPTPGATTTPSAGDSTRPGSGSGTQGGTHSTPPETSPTSPTSPLPTTSSPSPSATPSGENGDRTGSAATP